MANKVKPIKPGEVAKKKQDDFPDAAFEAFNEMIAEHYYGKVATFKQKDVEDLMVKKGLGRNDIYKKGWMDIEDVYTKAGWDVDYDRPGYNETYDATFTFRAHK
jgi:hypothetical protein